MTEYHKINAPFNRDGRGTLINGEWCMPEFEYLANLEWEFTEKVDGTNIRIEVNRINDSLFISYRGRTDNAQIPKPLLARLNELFGGPGDKRAWVNHSAQRGPYITDTIGHIMVERDIDTLVIYGEGYGPKIQNGGKYRSDVDFVVFDVKVGDWWLLRKDVNDFCNQTGLSSVPVIFRGTLWSAMQLVRSGYARDLAGNYVKRIIEVNGREGMRSQWGDFEAEGLVGVPAIPLFDRAGRRIITKIKAKDFR